MQRLAIIESISSGRLLHLVLICSALILPVINRCDARTLHHDHAKKQQAADALPGPPDDSEEVAPSDVDAGSISFPKSLPAISISIRTSVLMPRQPLIEKAMAHLQRRSHCQWAYESDRNELRIPKRLRWVNRCEKRSDVESGLENSSAVCETVFSYVPVIRFDESEGVWVPEWTKIPVGCTLSDPVVIPAEHTKD